MQGLVVGTNLKAATSIVQTLAIHGFRITFHQLFHLPATLAQLRHAAHDAVVFLCDLGQASRLPACPHVAAKTPISPSAISPSAISPSPKPVPAPACPATSAPTAIRCRFS